jgi:hypothetical protein
MSYADFTMSRLEKQFILTFEEKTDLYFSVQPVSVRPEFESDLAQTVPLELAISTEKARSEFIIAPILTEFWKLAGQMVGLHSGVDFSVDPESGLAGTCDFVITRSPEQLFIKAPAILLVEAKNEDMKRGYAQCVAEMLAAQKFNERENTVYDKVYGAVTIGEKWKFLELEGNIVRIDVRDYAIRDLGMILGILIYMTTR